MRRQLSTLLGELIQQHSTVEELKKNHKTIWQSITQSVDVMLRVTELAEKLQPAIGAATRALPYLGSLLGG